MHEEVYLSFAAFLYIIKETKMKYVDNDDYIGLCFGNGYFLFSINRKKGNSDCGYLAISSENYEPLFRNYTHFVNPAPDVPQPDDFYEFIACERQKERLSDGSIAHCTVDELTRSKIDIKRKNGEQVKCLNLNAPQENSAITSL